MMVMDHSNMNAPMAFMPMQDAKGNEMATIVILHNNASISASQDKIAQTLAIAA